MKDVPIDFECEDDDKNLDDDDANDLDLLHDNDDDVDSDANNLDLLPDDGDNGKTKLNNVILEYYYSLRFFRYFRHLIFCSSIYILH